jgi:hypothetical protein
MKTKLHDDESVLYSVPSVKVQCLLDDLTFERDVAVRRHASLSECLPAMSRELKELTARLCCFAEDAKKAGHSELAASALAAFQLMYAREQDDAAIQGVYSCANVIFRLHGEISLLKQRVAAANELVKEEDSNKS